MPGAPKPNIVFRPHHSGLGKFWGKLEAELLEIIWDNGPMTVKRALYFVNQQEKHAYTTVMTVMNHLVDKGILNREKVSHSFVYQPVMTKAEFLNHAITTIMAALVDEFENETAPVLAGYAPRLRKGKPGRPNRDK